MTSSTFKKYEEFVNEELDKFYEDLEDNSKEYKFPVNIKKKDYDYNNSNKLEFEVKKRKNIKKTKKTWSGVDKSKNLF
jgi:hypothetical protein